MSKKDNIDRTPLPPRGDDLPLGKLPRDYSPTTRYPKVIHAPDIEPRKMLWLWYPYIPIGTTSMLFGPGGIGKSHIACDIAAAITTGRPLPGQSPEKQRRPQRVLLMSAEDDLQVVLQPRLVRAGADLEFVYIPEEAFTLDKEGIDQVGKWIKDLDCTVAIIDPVVAYVGGKVDMNRMNEVRAFTGALTHVAMHTQCAMLLVHHSRKAGGDGSDAEKAAGSVDFNNAVRSTLYCNRTDDGTRFMKHVKTNYAKEGPTLTYEFDDADNFQWTGLIDDDLLVQLRAPTSRPRPKAAEFIREALKNGPMKSVDILEMAANEDINARTLNRAKEGLAESFIVRENDQNVWYWRLL